MIVNAIARESSSIFYMIVKKYFQNTFASCIFLIA